MQDARKIEEQSTLKRSRILGISYFDTSAVAQKQIYNGLLEVRELYQLRVIPLIVEKSTILFGVTNMTSRNTMETLKNRFLDQRVSFSLISDAGFREYMKLYDPPKKIEYQDITIKPQGADDLLSKVSEVLNQVKPDDMLAYIVQQAHRLGASDIHLETHPDKLGVRFRIDGVLHTVAGVQLDKYRPLLASIASSANISTASNESQQGHIAQKVTMSDGTVVDVNVRLETVTTIHGMDVVMRLFNMEQSMYTLDRLGLSSSAREVIDKIINQPSGLVLVVGPTGSGKTTTLYSMLNSLNNDERKIITLEDPVEYQFSGITQISVTTKTSQEVSFAEKLRAILRLDPDIIMVGEVRDTDTAKTALQASLTGHLVMSTFHASSASAALARLSDIIGQNPLFLSAIRLVMAQRLVRRLDDKTKQPYKPSEQVLQNVKKIIDSFPEGAPRPNLDTVQFYTQGKSEENPYGFKGQIALREHFVMSDAIRGLFDSGKPITSSKMIEQTAVRDGMMTLLQEGILKACSGDTTLDEVFRVA